jgi:hypothetical protein
MEVVLPMPPFDPGKTNNNYFMDEERVAVWKLAEKRPRNPSWKRSRVEHGRD